MKKILNTMLVLVALLVVLTTTSMAITFVRAINTQIPANGTTASVSFDCTGADYLVVTFLEASSGDATSVTFNTFALTKVAEHNLGTNFISWWVLPAPTTGSHTLTVNQTPNSTIRYAAACYLGAKQSATIDSNAVSGSLSSGSAGNATFSYTTNAANCWIIASMNNTGANDQDNDSTNGLTFRGTANQGRETQIWDSNASLAAGAHTIGFKYSGAYTVKIGAISIAPPTPPSNGNFLAFM